ncbi:MAG: aminoglycoside phosphotransferase family protein [Oscillospiraceae bacterium]|nr:aminoglycoside phosphotransferase family protein [Oscillospiraceae bacterium]
MKFRITRLQHKKREGTSTWRIQAGKASYIIKHFSKPENRREIENYRILQSLGIPTPRVIAQGKRTLLLEDLANGPWRLGVKEDMDDPAVAVLVAAWYRQLHENGRAYAQTHDLYDETDFYINPKNLALIGRKTGAESLPIWPVLTERLPRIKQAAMALPRTLTYNDFHYNNLAVAKDGSAALVFDYDILGKGYVYGDIRNICYNMGEAAKEAFFAAYGEFDKTEIVIDDIAGVLVSLGYICHLDKEKFPRWGEGVLGVLKGWTEKDLFLPL